MLPVCCAEEGGLGEVDWTSELMIAPLRLPGKIFVNYRRDDERSTAARIRDRLASAFGDANVFMDVDNLLAGQRFDKELEKALNETDVFLAVIGPHWLELLGKRQASGERDFVREEIAGALKRDIVVIPLLIEQTPLPRGDALPEDIRDLVLYQKQVVTHEQFGRDVAGLVEAISFARKAAAAPQAARDLADFVDEAPAGGSEDRRRAAGWLLLLLLLLGVVVFVASHQNAPRGREVAVTDPVLIERLNASAHYAQGDRYLYVRDYDRAIAEYTKAIAHGSHEAKIYFNRGLAYYGKNDHNSAIADYAQALKISPRDADAYYNSGAAYEALGRRVDAIRVYRWALEIDPNHQHSKDGLKRLGAL